MIGVAVLCFKPCEILLRKAVDSLAGEAGIIIIFDNGGADFPWLREISSVKYIKSDMNIGISGLNIAVGELITHGVDFILILDQDSCLEQGYCESAVRRIREAKGNVVCSPFIDESNRGGSQNAIKKKKIEFVIGSGMLMSRETWKLVGGFNETLFLDMVDVEWWHRARKARVRPVVLSDYHMTHSIGDGCYQFLFWEVSKHNVFRHYLYYRNVTYLVVHDAPIKWKFFSAIKVLCQCLVYCCVTGNPVKEFSAFVLGVFDGVRLRGMSKRTLIFRANSKILGGRYKC